jgi:hypothetical protein
MKIETLSLIACATALFYPGEALIVALLLAFVPYLLIRGPAERIARRWMDRKIAVKKT